MDRWKHVSVLWPADSMYRVSGRDCRGQRVIDEFKLTVQTEENKMMDGACAKIGKLGLWVQEETHRKPDSICPMQQTRPSDEPDQGTTGTEGPDTHGAVSGENIE
ncbi:hypothetical protein EYF80_005083 [Liparis tanakae]|uniref:Uncharacterized protein n=1 Tax=Liparis tanakae TaxID=230148 RepID=A0A4Z2J4Q1_9TELE|nr:hypothetical protein EYF80_005083 [Liparis tanakae]